MLTPEQAKQETQRFLHKDWRDRRLDRIGRFPESLRAAAEALIKNDDAVYGGTFGKRWDKSLRLTDALDRCNVGRRRDFFEALFPHLGMYVEAGWQASTRRPYQVGFLRKAFRAPDEPDLTRAYRANWIGELLGNLCGYEEDVAWWAAWTPHLELHLHGTGSLGIPSSVSPGAIADLLAAAIDTGDETGEQVLEVLCASARGEHEIGTIGRHVIQALLTASRPEGWECIERLLLAAQRQEGLRQVIVETIDLAHPTAFRRMLGLIREHDLHRFSSVVRAMDVWFGMQWDSAAAKAVRTSLDQVSCFVEDVDARRAAIAEGAGEACYLALWAHAFGDAPEAVVLAAPLLQDANVERRFVAVHLLAQLGLPAAQREMLAALDDEDLRLPARVMQEFVQGVPESLENVDLFEYGVRLSSRAPRGKKTLAPLVWPWCAYAVDRYLPSRLFADGLGKRPAAALEPYLDFIEPSHRAHLARRLAERKRWDAATRRMLFQLASDASPTVRAAAFVALESARISADEARELEALLTRTASDLRTAALTVLLKQSDTAALASAERLLQADAEPQRLAGVEMLRVLHEAQRLSARVRARAVAYRAERATLSQSEQDQLDAILGTAAAISLDDGLGLFDPAQRTKPASPVRQSVVLDSDAALACLHSLDDLIHEHRETPIPPNPSRRLGQDEVLLGSCMWAIPHPDARLSLEEDLPNLPLRELWETWERERPAELRDSDGLELLRALGMLTGACLDPSGRLFERMAIVLKRRLRPRKSLCYTSQVNAILWWFGRRYQAKEVSGFLLDAIETSFAAVPAEQLAHVPDPKDWRDHDWRSSYRQLPWREWLEIARQLSRYTPNLWQKRQMKRLWPLLRWMDEPGTAVPRRRPDWDETVQAFRYGVATEADVLDHLLGPRSSERWGRTFWELGRMTARKLPRDLQDVPALRELVERCRLRILEIELKRGDTPTPASEPALELRYLAGATTLIDLLKALGKLKLKRGWLRGDTSKAGVLSHLISVTVPDESDTPEQFATMVAAEGIAERRLVETALLAPQWARHVECAIGWPAFAEAVWWTHAHTKDSQWRVDQEIRELWNAQISERTPLTGPELLDGAVDVAWFGRIIAILGAERWEQVHAAAKYAAGGNGHARAQLFAYAMLGRVDQAAILQRMKEKRHQDSARSLGLLPLAAGDARAADLLARYRALDDFLRSGRQFGAQRRASEKRAVEIGLDNLARTAGFPDPLRLQWAMEREALSDLAAGPIVLNDGDLTVTLSLDEFGAPHVEAVRRGRTLKSLPAQVKKSRLDIADLAARRAELKRQGARIRQSLENSMCRGDEFTGSELRELSGHPILAPALARLVLIGTHATGYPVDGGQALCDHAGQRQPIGSDERLRIAHSFDLLQTGAWHAWQRECFQIERVQPFKQVFRELYVLTSAERTEGTRSTRYAGHQVQPKQALAVLGSRGWVHHPEEGLHRTDHACGITAWIEFEDYFCTPAEVEGLTVSGVIFAPSGDWKPMSLADVPPRVFSETMRDVDLMVSVAHRGGVDPEASASTVEMRAALLREMIPLLELQNVRLQSTHALIDGRLGNYSIHLGSAVVHKLPGGHLCIVPVHAQHRGRLFLPFADDDPKTAEVLSKVLLLARDDEIKDPTILEQIRAMPS